MLGAVKLTVSLEMCHFNWILLM